MQVSFRDGGAQVAHASLDLQLTLVDSAQAFHWRKVAGAYAAVVDGRAVRLCPQEEGFSLTPCAPEDWPFWRRYLDLDRDYGALVEECAHLAPMARQALDRLPGLRILNQPTWEALVSFILSANNNVGRIQSLVAAVCRALGSAHPLEGVGMLHGFPSPERLLSAGEEALRQLGCGYRAPYLVGTARAVTEGFPLEALSGMAYPEALKRLVSLPGVGEKVADCVLLFGCGHADAFPVDVWVERMMLSWFTPELKGRKRIKQQGRVLFGPHAGLLQQYLFHCARTGLLPLEEAEGRQIEDRGLSV